MAFQFQDRSLSKIGVIGSGQIGPDIALFFAKVFAERGVDVVVVDVAQGALDAGKARTEKKIRKGQESGVSQVSPPVDPGWRPSPWAGSLGSQYAG